jgi:histidyl-tRNA synthetase
MAALQPVRGTHDCLPPEANARRRLIETARSAAARYGYGEVATPIFEFTDVFARTLGDTSDVVSKEMYSFTDRGGESLTLRPEFTAGLVRALISNGLTQILPQKWFTTGPVFRYERPQKGRMRQFHQLDIECFGVAEPTADIEVIALGMEILERLGICEGLTLQLNSLGDPESRTQYREALVAYLEARKSSLSPESQERLLKNPLRVLDSKQAQDQEIVRDAPRVTDHLTPEAARFYDRVKEGLTALSIPFTENPRLVRGLDYYSHTVFEVVTDRLGAQGTVLAGGRYDGLVAQMGGPAVPGIGWGAGIERLLALMAEETASVTPLVVIALSEAMSLPALQVAHQLHQAGLHAELIHAIGFKKGLKIANRLQAKRAILIGDEEWAAGQVALKDLTSGEQRVVAIESLTMALGTLPSP